MFRVSLRCSMDIQCSDGRSMLLCYVTSYVTRLRDHQFTYGEYISYMQNITIFCIEIILYCIKATYILLII